MSEGSLLVDCDPGLDDALALAFLTGLDEPIEAVTAVGGNFPVEVTAANARYVVARLGLSVPVCAGADGLGVGRRDSAAFHGPDGLGGLSEAVPAPGEQRSAQAALSDQLALSRPVLATGPLTNVAALASAGSRSTITVMGGAFGHPTGNVTPWAEFNWWCDAPAADRLMGSGLDVMVVGLDITQQVGFAEEDTAGLANFAGELLRRRIELARAAPARSGPTAWVHDAVAAVLTLEPALAEWTAGHVDVVTEGEQQGAARFRPGDGPVRVATQIDAVAVRERLLTAWARVP